MRYGYTEGGIHIPSMIAAIIISILMFGGITFVTVTAIYCPIVVIVLGTIALGLGAVFIFAMIVLVIYHSIEPAPPEQGD